MRGFTRHTDGLLARWSEGTLSPRQSARLMRHVRACARCAHRYERRVLAHRMLERGEPHTPTETEEAVLGEAGLAAALAAAEPEPERWRWPSLALVGGTLVALGLATLVLVRPGEVGEWQPRGVGRPTGAVVRVFCAERQRPLRELKEERACPPGAQLAFAVGMEAPLSHVAVAVRGAGQEVTEGPFAVRARPGAEQPLEVTIPLWMPAGETEVVAAFADSPRGALEALRGAVTPGAVVLRQQVRVEEAP
jgi:hypothetical protein